MRPRFLFVLAIMFAGFANISPVSALSPSCDQCDDIPELYRELLERMIVRNIVKSFRENRNSRPNTVAELQAALLARASAAFGGVEYTPSTVGAPKNGSANAPFYTDLSSSSCDIKKADTGEIVTPTNIRKWLCPPLADEIMLHEGHHQASCHSDLWGTDGGKGGPSVILKYDQQHVSWYLDEDLAAYDAGIKYLQNYIAELSLKCKWTPSQCKRICMETVDFNVLQVPGKTIDKKAECQSRCKFYLVKDAWKEVERFQNSANKITNLLNNSTH